MIENIACVFFFSFVYVVMMLMDKQFHITDADPESRSRLYKYTLVQDIILLITVMKMVIFERCSLEALVEKVRNSGPMMRLYAATALMLHGVLLFDETTDHLERLNPRAYTPANVSEATLDLFLL